MSCKNNLIFQKFVRSLIFINKDEFVFIYRSGNGMVQVFNMTLFSIISANVDDNQKDWDFHLSLLMSTYRACAHNSSGLSPNLFMLGREVYQQISLVYGIPGLSERDVSSVEYVCVHFWTCKRQVIIPCLM